MRVMHPYVEVPDHSDARMCAKDTSPNSLCGDMVLAKILDLSELFKVPCFGGALYGDSKAVVHKGSGGGGGGGGGGAGTPQPCQ